MNKVNFVFRNRIYVMSEEGESILVCKENGDQVLQTNCHELSEVSSPFEKLACAVYRTMICGAKTAY